MEDMLERIAQTEQKAKSVLEDARKLADVIMQEAGVQKKIIMDETRQAAVEQAVVIVRKAQSLASEEKEKILKEAQRKSEDFSKRCEPLVSGLAEKIFEEVIRTSE